MQRPGHSGGRTGSLKGRPRRWSLHRSDPALVGIVQEHLHALDAAALAGWCVRIERESLDDIPANWNEIACGGIVELQSDAAQCGRTDTSSLDAKALAEASWPT